MLFCNNNIFVSGNAPKDHLAENVRRMRHIQRESRKKQSDSAAPVKGLWKSSKYENVTSKVKIELKVKFTSHDSLHEKFKQ